MPDPRELMMLAQQGGGGGAPQMPPGGGDPRMAAAMQQKLAQLMQDPVARAGMQAHMQGQDPRAAGAQIAMQGGGINRNIGPQALSGPMGREVVRGGDAPFNPYAKEASELATGPQSGRSSPATDQELYDTQEANQGVRGNLPPIDDKGGYTGYGDEDTPQDPRQTPMPMKPGEEQNMVSQEIDRKGATFDGNKAPTANDIERLDADRSPEMIEAFEAQFGAGSAKEYLEELGNDPLEE